MRSIRLLWPLVGAALALTSLPRPALAQAPPPGEERPTILLGPFEVRPRVVLNHIGVDNNIFNEREDPKRDFTFTFQPDVELTYKPGRLKVVALAGTEYVYFKEYDSERALNRSASVNAQLDLPLIRPFVSYAAAHTSTRPSPEIDARAGRHPRSFGGGATFKIGTRTSATVKWTENRERYDADEIFRGQQLAQTLDNTSQVIEAGVAVQLTPITSFTVVYAREELRFDAARVRDADSTRITPTISFSPLGLINGTASVGYRKVEGLDPALPSFRGLAMNGTLATVFASRYRLETRFTRDLQYSYEQTVPYYILTGGRATLIARLSELIDVRATAGHDRMRYRAFEDGVTPGTDRQTVYGGGIGFLIGDRKRFIIQAERAERHSGRDILRDYRNHRIFGTLSWGA